MNLGLDGRTALVTAAASRGIGLATARRLVDEGARVAIVARDGASLDAASRSVGSSADRISIHQTDLTDPVSVDAMLADVVEQFGRLDIAVLNTGGPPIGGVLGHQLDAWDAAYRLLLRPVVQIGTFVATHMAANGEGSIVMLTSTWVKQPQAGGVLSASFRAAVAAFAKSLSIELASSGVRVNQVLPGATGTSRMVDIVRAHAAQHGTSEDHERSAVISQIPLGRWAEPHEIADAGAFLASPVSAFTTGASLQVDGGAVRSTV